MKLHGNAKLSLASRRLLVDRVLRQGWRAADAADSLGVSTRTVYKWIRRYREGGEDALRDRSSRPSRCPHKTSSKLTRRVLRLRRRRLVAWEISERTGVPRSTVSRLLRGHGVGLLKNLEPKEPVKRYEKSRPGELVHIDIKKLARFKRPGHRIHGDRKKNSRGSGWEHVHVAVDDFTRLAYAEVLADERKETVADFLSRAHSFYEHKGIRIERILTDRGSGYNSHHFRDRCEEVGVRHSQTRPYRPQTNGKAERFIQTMSRKWAYARSYRSSKARANALTGWIDNYNRTRPHRALGGISPCDRLNAAL